MATRVKYESTPEDPKPYPELSYKQLQQKGNEVKYKARMAWVNRQSYKVHGSARADRKQMRKQAEKSAAPAPTPFQDDSAEFYSLLKITPLHEPFEQASKNKHEGVRKPQTENAGPSAENILDDDDFYEEEETAKPGADHNEHEYVQMDDAKAYLFVRLSNFMAAIATKLFFSAIGYNTDMDAMKLSQKDVETMAEDAKWFIKDVGMTPQQMYGFSLFGTVAMNGFYASEKQEHPWWEKFTKKKKSGYTNASGPFRVHRDDRDDDIYEAEVI